MYIKNTRFYELSDNLKAEILVKFMTVEKINGFIAEIKSHNELIRHSMANQPDLCDGLIELNNNIIADNDLLIAELQAILEKED